MTIINVILLQTLRNFIEVPQLLQLPTCKSPTLPDLNH